MERDRHEKSDCDTVSHNHSSHNFKNYCTLCNPLLSIMSIVFEGGKCKKVVCACFSRTFQSQNDFIMFNFSDEKTSWYRGWTMNPRSQEWLPVTNINLSTRPGTSMTGRPRSPLTRWRCLEGLGWTRRSAERRTVQWQLSALPRIQAGRIRTMSGIGRPSGTTW